MTAIAIAASRFLPALSESGLLRSREVMVSGISVECRLGLEIAQLSVAIPHGQIGATTVKAIREAGGDVIRTSGRSQYHATLTGLSPSEISRLFTPTLPNPSLEKK